MITFSQSMAFGCTVMVIGISIYVIVRLIKEKKEKNK